MKMIKQGRLGRVAIMFFLMLVLIVLLPACESSGGSTSSGNSGNSGTPAPVYNAPSWWNGQDCNKGSFPQAYDLLGYDSSGKPKTWRGIEVCGPLPGLNSTGSIEDFHDFGAGADQYMFQCTELVARYLWAAYNLRSQIANGSQIVDAYTSLQNVPFHKVVNDGNTSVAPVEGDILSYGPTANNSAGHTSIVTGSSVDGSGDGTINVIQQNIAWNGTARPTEMLNVRKWVIQASAYGAGSVISWMTTRPVASQAPSPTPVVLSSGTWQDPYGGSSYVGDAVTMKLTVQESMFSGTLTGTTGDSTAVHGQDGPLSLFSPGDQQYLNFVVQNFGAGTGLFVVFSNDSQFEGAETNSKYYGVVQQNGDIQGFWYFPSASNPAEDVGSIHMNKLV